MQISLITLRLFINNINVTDYEVCSCFIFCGRIRSKGACYKRECYVVGWESDEGRVNIILGACTLYL